MADNPAFDSAVETIPNDYLIPSGADRVLKSVLASFDGSGASSAFVPTVQILAPSGAVVATAVCAVDVAAGGSADVTWFPGGELEEEAPFGPGVIVETLFLNTTSPTGATSSTVLQAGQEYVITAQGTWSTWNFNLDVGTPNADAMFPGSGGDPRMSTEVGLDPECCFAYQSGFGPTNGLAHVDLFQMNLAGAGYQHIEPEGGPFNTPQPNYLYTYKVVGQGHAVGFIVNEPGSYNDNYGLIQITIQSLNGNPSGGGGGGALLPPTGSNNSLLRVLAGIPAWAAQPDITESDLSLSNVTTDDVSTSRHGFAPKAPNDATKFLNGVGAYSVPAGSGGTISDLTSTGGTITVGSPTGPTTNVDLPTSGVTAGTYGDATDVGRFTVDAEGRITAASSVAISGIAGTGLVKIFDSTLGANAATIDTGAGGIPAGHADLIVLAVVQTVDAGANVTLILNVNNDSGANYDIQVLAGANATTTAGATVAQIGWRTAGHGAGGSANYPAIVRMTIPSYDQTTFFKVAEITSFVPDATAANMEADLRAGGWRSTAAITRLSIAANSSANLKAGSRLVVYGTK